MWKFAKLAEYFTPATLWGKSLYGKAGCGKCGHFMRVVLSKVRFRGEQRQVLRFEAISILRSAPVECQGSLNWCFVAENVWHPFKWNVVTVTWNMDSYLWTDAWRMGDSQLNSDIKCFRERGWCRWSKIHSQYAYGFGPLTSVFIFKMWSPVIQNSHSKNSHLIIQS